MRSVRLRRGDQTREIRLEKDAALLDGRRVAFERRARDGRLAELVIEGRAHRVATARQGDHVFVWCDGDTLVFEQIRGTRSAASEHARDLASPMPGRVRRILVGPGETVTRGEVLMVLEAMKMEHSIRAPKDGVVKRLLVREGDLVESGVELAEME